MLGMLLLRTTDDEGVVVGVVVMLVTGVRRLDESLRSS